jgi:hypothetical protein
VRKLVSLTHLASCFDTREFSAGTISADSVRKLVSFTLNFGIPFALFWFNEDESNSFEEGDRN